MPDAERIVSSNFSHLVSADSQNARPILLQSKRATFSPAALVAELLTQQSDFRSQLGFDFRFGFQSFRLGVVFHPFELIAERIDSVGDFDRGLLHAGGNECDDPQEEQHLADGRGEPAGRCVINRSAQVPDKDHAGADRQRGGSYISERLPKPGNPIERLDWPPHPCRIEMRPLQA